MFTHITSVSLSLCAVLGSKQLKALVVEGDSEVEIAAPTTLKELRRSLAATYKDDWWVSLQRSGGTVRGLDPNGQPLRNTLENLSLGRRGG